MDKIKRYFPGLTARQLEQFELMGPLYAEWNEKINVISRRDIANVYCNHILHSLAIAKFFTPAPGTSFMDLGTGGGFPAMPLAVIWPDCRFHLIDRIAKKLRVAADIADKLGLTNVTFQHGDSGECHQKFDYVLSRAVMTLPELIRASRPNVAVKACNGNPIPSGLICLKGGDLSAEIAEARHPVLEVPLSDWFREPYFESKELIYINL